MPAQNIAVSHADTGLVTAEVTRAERISPSFVRLTISGPDVREWRDLGFDQWFRLAIPVAGEATRFDRMSERFDMRGYLRYLTLPKATRPAIRNYTVREFRAELGELDIDFVVHGGDANDGAGPGTAGHSAAADRGIAGPWAAELPIGARVALIDQGCGFTAPAPGDPAPHVLLAGDESALPAVAGILRDLPADATGDAIIEVPDPADRQELQHPAGVRVHWLDRAATAAAPTAAPAAARPGAAALDALRALPSGRQPGGAIPSHAFVAGEQQLASGGRKHLVGTLGMPRDAVTFCGYWRQK
ncbi:siderophore-interacting protein [Leucobacter chromiireducens]|uniref:siderophore-interacting protein n=1 Tax=Leucobacter chromiireducens TaxID=283877 RepID=UPI000F638BEF|nr:siderophore-interacting protein [Leucobacter chromiireducens]